MHCPTLSEFSKNPRVPHPFGPAGNKIACSDTSQRNHDAIRSAYATQGTTKQHQIPFPMTPSKPFYNSFQTWLQSYTVQAACLTISWHFRGTEETSIGFHSNYHMQDFHLWQEHGDPAF